LGVQGAYQMSRLNREQDPVCQQRVMAHSDSWQAGARIAACSGPAQWTVIVAMAAMGVMEVSIDQVVHVIAMRNRFVATSGPMHVGSIMTPAAVLRRAPVRIGR
jgi:hypothetical protein